MDDKRGILLIRLKSIGDVLFTLPAAHRLRAAYPEARLSYLVSAENASLLEGFEPVDDVLKLDRTAYRGGNPVRMLQATGQLLRELRAVRPRLVVDFQGYGETGALVWLTRAPQRWGVVYRRARRWAYHRPVRRDDAIHPAEFNLRLLDQCGVPPAPLVNRFRIPEAHLTEARRWLADHNLKEPQRLVFVQPFTSSPHKNWPLEKYLELAGRWRARGVNVIFGGGPADRGALAPAASRGFPVSAGTPLLVTAALMAHAGLILGGDTGLLHLAVAAGKRVVMLMHTVSPGNTHPFQHPDWAVTPADHQQLSQVEVDAVEAACSRSLS